MARQTPWLAPLVLPPEMQERLDRAHERLNAAFGTVIPKAAFVRMLLDRGARVLDEEVAHVGPGASRGSPPPKKRAKQRSR